MIKMISWNVNGIRACINKGFWDWFETTKPDFLCLQEVKALPEQVPIPERFSDYHLFWNSAKKKGYSGVATFCKEKPISVSNLGEPIFDDEGRAQILEFTNWKLLNCYFPNSQEKGKRIDYKINFCNKIKQYCDDTIKNGKNIIICGDYNIAHKPIDLKNPKPNEKNPGYLPEERQWMGEFLESSYIDTFRHFYPDKTDCYSWWSYRFQSRSKNIGWRIDYFSVNKELKGKLYSGDILNDIIGSDHCPVSIDINLTY